MKLRLPNKLIAAIVAAATPALFSTLSTATLGQQAMAADTATWYVIDENKSYSQLPADIQSSTTVGFEVNEGVTFTATGKNIGSADAREVKLHNQAVLSSGTADTNTNERQIEKLTIDGTSATVLVDGNIGIVNNEHGVSGLVLNGNTLTLKRTAETPSNLKNFWLWSTAVDAGTINVEKGVTLKVGRQNNNKAFPTFNDGTIIHVASGAEADFTSMAYTDDGEETRGSKFYKLFNMTSGDGLVKLQFNSTTKMTNQNITFGANYEVTGGGANTSLVFNTWSNQKTYTIQEGKSFTLKNANLRLESQAKMVAVGDLSVSNTLYLGYAGSANVKTQGELHITGGNVSINTIQIDNSNNAAANILEMTSGSLTITGSNMFANTANNVNVNFSGGKLIASAEGNSWVLNRNATIGNVTIETAASKSITFGSASSTTTINGTVNNTGSLVIQGGLSLGDDAAVTNSGDLEIKTSANNTGILAKVTGAGAVTVSSNQTVGNNVTLGSTGALTVTNGATLTLAESKWNPTLLGWTDDGGSKGFSSVTLAGGTIKSSASLGIVRDLTVKSDTTGNKITFADFDDWNSDGTPAATTVFAGTTTLNSNLEVYTAWKSSMNFETLTGNGDLSFTTGGNSDAKGINVEIGSVNGYTGTLKFLGTANDKVFATIKTGTNNTLSGGVALQNAELNIWSNNDANQRIHNVGAVEVLADSVIASANGGFHGQIDIDSLSGSGNLLLAQRSKVPYATVFNINGGDANDYTGTLRVKLDYTDIHNSGRHVALNIKDKDALSGAVISLESANNSTSHVGLGIATDASVKGINSTDTYGQKIIFSGAAGVGVTSFASGNDKYTLTITGDGEYATSAKIDKNINLAMSGTGSQSFSGDMSTFNGDIKATAGILQLLNQTSVNVENLTITGQDATHRAEVGVYSTATKDTAHEAGISVSGTLTANQHATLNANLTMKDGSTINVAVNSENYMAGGLTMGSTVTFENEGKIKLSNDIINGLNSLTIGEGLTLFSGVDSFYINDAVYDEGATYAASDYFNLTGVTRPWDFVVKFDVPAGSQQGGAVYLWMETPEPATATLSLLALAALAARRKRK